MHESFLKYEHYRYLKLALAVCLLSIAAYALHSPAVAPNGGTWLGYTLGTIGAGLIGWLLWFGIRKRQYRSVAGTLKGWLSGHIYLGTALIIIATLHTGFQFGWNIHTLCYVLMLLVIFSGFYGLYVYIQYPDQMSQLRKGANREAMLREMKDLDDAALELAKELGHNAHEVILRSIEKSRVGGGAWQQLTARRLGTDAISGIEEYLTSYRKNLEENTLFLDHRVLSAGSPSQGGRGSEATVMYISSALKDLKSDKFDRVRHLLETTARKKTLLKRIRRDIQLKAILQLWLYVHVPLSIALLATLLIHITSVFWYW
jgi:hypothetical protein